MWYFKSHFYASTKMTWSPSISNHALFVAGHILDLVEVQCSAWEVCFWNAVIRAPWKKKITVDKSDVEGSQRAKQLVTEAGRLTICSTSVSILWPLRSCFSIFVLLSGPSNCGTQDQVCVMAPELCNLHQHLVGVALFLFTSFGSQSNKPLKVISH